MKDMEQPWGAHTIISNAALPVNPHCPAQTQYLSIGTATLCGDCMKDRNAIRVADELMVMIEKERLVMRRGSASVAVLPSEIKHLVDALVDRVKEW